ncbi:response regulator [Oceanobacter mangrovi]|uniref:response regulator n=1 Tax=Oceanobacter mangrovi TaxID=2862510 RepID=UPI001C8DD65F|nr:response regulator [Oceanobacter mangrovi]
MAELTFLLVDDAAFIRDLVKKAVRQTYPGCNLVEAINGRKAVTALGSNRVDVVLCDWEMPEMSGIEVLQWMRSDERYKNTPFMMITSRGDKEHVVKAVEAGVSDYIGKPFSRDSFVDKLTRMVFRHLKVRPSQQAGTVSSRGDMGGASVLMGNVGNQALTKKQETKTITEVSPLLAAASASSVAAAAPTAGKPGVRAMGLATVRFASGSEAKLVIKDMSLQEMLGVFKRTGDVPQLLEQAVIDIADEEQKILARVNGFVRMIQAQEPHPDAETIQIRIRLVDDDPDKLDAVSRFIARTR